MPALWSTTFERFGAATCLLFTVACQPVVKDTLSSGGKGAADSGGAVNGGTGASEEAGMAGAALGGAAAAVGGVAGASTAGGQLTSGGQAAGGAAAVPGKLVVFVGGYDSELVVSYDLDVTTGQLTERASGVAAGADPAYLALDPQGRCLYAANEAGEGGVTALRVAADGSLTTLNHQPGPGLAHLAVAPSGKFVIGASYGGGRAVVYPLADDCSVGAVAHSLDLGENSMAHSVAYDKAGGYVLVPTPGSDSVAQLVLGIDGVLSNNEPASAPSSTGARPRHIAVHPDGKLAFVINEQGSSITSYQLSANGTLSPVASVSALPDNYAQESVGAHIEVSPDGRFVFASNRGHDSIVVFAVDQAGGGLSLVEHEPTRGLTPRDFEVDPNGRFLVVANQDSNNLSVFAIADDGYLTPLVNTVATRPKPAAVQILHLR